MSKDLKKTIVIMAVLVVAVIIGIKIYNKANEPVPTVSGKYTADIVVQDYGTITVELDADAAPLTVENFIKLANEGFYDGLRFHRVYPHFMIQGGSPESDGVGGSGECIKGEFSSNGVDNPLSHTRGCISMARTQLPDSASSQFFIVHEDSTYLDGDYAAFGYVTEGMEVVDAICDVIASGSVICDSNGVIQSIDDMPVITTITIRD